MRDYHDYEQVNIGGSDIASLVLAGNVKDTGLTTQVLSFGEDGDYSAYVVDADAKIGDHYSKVAEFDTWLKIYDDDGLANTFRASKINIYRAGEMGCIIQLI